MLQKTKGATVPTAGEQSVVIEPLNLQRATFHIVGTAPLVQLKFSEKQRDAIREVHAAGEEGKKAKRGKKDFEGLFKGAQHLSTEGWHGVPCSAFRHGLIDTCRVANTKMTIAKMTIFCVADGYDADGMGLVRITKGKPRHVEHITRNANGMPDIRVRAMFDTWEIKVTLEWDADQFSAVSVANLLARMGVQCGIGEGRPFSKASPGMGWGTFRISEGA